MSRSDTPMVQSHVPQKYVDRKMLKNQLVELCHEDSGTSLSRGAPSTTRPPLRCGPDTCKSLADQAFSADPGDECKIYFLQVDTPVCGTTHEPSAQYDTSTAQSCSLPVRMGLALFAYVAYIAYVEQRKAQRMSDEKENLTERFNMFMSPSEMKAIDEWAWANRIRSKSEAVRRLCRIGLEAQKAKESEE